MRAGELPAGELRAIAYERQEGRCAVTGAPLGDVDGSWHLHHRRPGGMGGTRRRGQQRPGNVVALLARVHNFGAPGLLLDGAVRSVHGDPAWSEPLGLLLPTSVDEPGSRPVRLWDGWAFLLDDGSVIRLGRG
jgi:hypothetical protein